MSVRRNVLVWVLTLGCVALARALPSAAAPTRVRALDIHEASLAKALAELAREAGVELLFDRKLVQNVGAKPVRGRLSPDAALAALLAGSGIGYRATPDGAFVLFALPVRRPRRPVTARSRRYWWSEAGPRTPTSAAPRTTSSPTRSRASATSRPPSGITSISSCVAASPRTSRSARRARIPPRSGRPARRSTFELRLAADPGARRRTADAQPAVHPGRVRPERSQRHPPGRDRARRGPDLDGGAASTDRAPSAASSTSCCGANIAGWTST